MARVLIIGYGNPLRSDDGFGWHAAEKLSSLLESPDIEVMACQQLTPELAETASHFQLVIFIDAAADRAPGEMRCEKVARVGQLEGSNFSHYYTPASLLALSAELYGKFPEAYSLVVGGKSFEDGESMSLAVRAAFDPVLDQVRLLISRG